MPIALDLSPQALRLYEQLIYQDSLGRAAFGIRLDIPRRDLVGMDRYSQDAWRELVDAGLAVESPDPWGCYSAYTYAGSA